MKTSKLIPQTGFVLLEALIALVVVAVGVLGIAKLNAVMLQGAGSSKAATEALQIAQDRIEQGRGFNMNLAGGCAGLAASTTTVTGTNATYTVATTYPEVTASLARVQVCVTWDGGACNTPGNRIILRSVMACEGSLGTSGRVGEGGAAGMRGDYIKTPTGRGQVGGRNYGGLPAGAAANSMPLDGGASVPDGTHTYTNPDDGTVELLDASGKVLLSVRKLPCEASAPAFSTISGKLFVAAKNGSPIAAESNLFVLSSDASYCSVLPYNTSNWKMPATATGNQIKYFYTYYQCYIGAEWWGNVGIVRTDNANSNDRVCVGNPLVSFSSDLFSKHARLSNSRAYRGYRLLESGVYETMGIGETNTLDTACTSGKKKVYTYTPHHFRNHHFVHANISGQSTCQSVETELNGLAPANQLGSSATALPSVSTTAAGKIVTANNNPGKYYCMSNDDGVSCVNLAPPQGDRETVVSGSITRINGAQLSGIADNGACTERTLTPNASGGYDYTCRINWEGFPAGSWSGNISFNAVGDATLCAAGSSMTAVVPSGSNVAWTVNDRFATDNPNSLYFTDIPNSVTSITLNFNVRPNNCGGVLGQPNVTCNSTAKTFSWAGITGANQYKVKTCGPVSTAGSPCTPSVEITQTGTTYPASGAISLSNGQMQCINVIASDTTGNMSDSPVSPTKCISRQGGYSCTPNSP